MAKSYFYDESISDWRELVKGEQGEQGPVGPVGPEGPQGIQGPMGTLELIGGDNPAITVDTSVGTRVFVGDTMIHGDTGVRRIEVVAEGYPALSWIRLARENSTVHIWFRANGNIEDHSETWDIYDLPEGFRPSSTGAAGNLFNAYTGGYAGDGSFAVFNNAVMVRSLTGTYRLGGSMSFYTTDPWPSFLPGTQG